MGTMLIKQEKKAIDDIILHFSFSSDFQSNQMLSKASWNKTHKTMVRALSQNQYRSDRTL